MGTSDAPGGGCSTGIGLWHLRWMHGCLRVPGPPNLGLSTQFLHVPQSSSVRHAAHALHGCVLDDGFARGAGGADGPLAPIFVVNIQMPLTAPPTFGEMPDGPCASTVMYFGCTAAAQQEAKGDNPSAAIALMREYCAKAPKPGESRKGNECCYTFKVIAKLENIDTLPLPASLKRFNGKPALINKSGLLHAGEGYLEMDVGIDKFTFLAKRGLYSVLDSLKTFDIHAGFVLQGNSDAELPEQIIGSARFPCVDYNVTHGMF